MFFNNLQNDESALDYDMSQLWSSPNTTNERAMCKNAALKRFQSLPVPFCRFENTKSFHENIYSPSKRQPLSEIFLSNREEIKPFLDDEDSHDSGISIGSGSVDSDSLDNQYDFLDDKENSFSFAQPCGIPPRKSKSLNQQFSPMKYLSPSVPSFKSLRFDLDNESPVKIKSNSLTDRIIDGDDGFFDLLDLDDVETSTFAPAGLGKLFGKKIVKPKLIKTKQTKLSFLPIEDQENIVPPRISNIRKDLFTPDYNSSPSFFSPKSSIKNSKRNEPCHDGETPKNNKRRKSLTILRSKSTKTPTKVASPRVQRSFSVNDEDIRSALSQSTQDSEMVGDYSRGYCLPTIPGRHPDLKSITSETLDNIIHGKFDHKIKNAVIIDCRYPYEYVAGQVKDALNLYTKESVMEQFFDNSQHLKYQNLKKPVVLIFHCEFSSERAPNMMRFLRNKDRELNRSDYPNLFYPEIYLLHNGYKDFFNTCKDSCEPQNYLPMNDKNHLDDLRHFRTKSKSWAAGEKNRSLFRTGLKL